MSLYRFICSAICSVEFVQKSIHNWIFNVFFIGKSIDRNNKNNNNNRTKQRNNFFIHFDIIYNILNCFFTIFCKWNIYFDLIIIPGFAEMDYCSSKRNSYWKWYIRQHVDSYLQYEYISWWFNRMLLRQYHTR